MPVRKIMILNYWKVYLINLYKLKYKNNILHVPDNLSTIWKKLRLNRSFLNGAEDEIRTRDVHLGKVTLYHWATPAFFTIHRIVKWCLRVESNRRHRDFQSLALPTELQRHMATRMRLELTTSSVTGWRSNQLNYRAITLYFHKVYLVGVTGLEPVTSCL